MIDYKDDDDKIVIGESLRIRMLKDDFNRIIELIKQGRLSFKDAEDSFKKLVEEKSDGGNNKS